MKRNFGFVIIVAIMTITLAGCGHNQATNQQAKDKSALKANMQNESSSAAASSSHEKQLSHYNYRVPKKERQSKNYVNNGNLTHKRQFSYDRFGTKQQLATATAAPLKLTDGQITYQVTKTKVLRNTAKTQVAKQAAEQVLSLQTIPDTYYTVVINYQITNHHRTIIALNGVNRIKTDQDQVLQINNQLVDSSAGAKLSPGETKSFVLTGYLRDYKINPVKKLAISFGPTFSEKGVQIDQAPRRALTLDLS